MSQAESHDFRAMVGELEDQVRQELWHENHSGLLVMAADFRFNPKAQADADTLAIFATELTDQSMLCASISDQTVADAWECVLEGCSEPDHPYWRFVIQKIFAPDQPLRWVVWHRYRTEMLLLTVEYDYPFISPTDEDTVDAFAWYRTQEVMGEDHLPLTFSAAWNLVRSGCSGPAHSYWVRIISGCLGLQFFS